MTKMDKYCILFVSQDEAVSRLEKRAAAAAAAGSTGSSGSYSAEAAHAR